MKLIAEAWDAGGLYQVGSFPSWNRWAEWNGRYRDDMRSFLKGDSGVAGRAITRITGSSDMSDPASRGYSASVNFLTCHDGFTLYDLYSYNEKHNEKNGWNNTDGDNNGLSWNLSWIIHSSYVQKKNTMIISSALPDNLRGMYSRMLCWRRSRSLHTVSR